MTLTERRMLVVALILGMLAAGIMAGKLPGGPFARVPEAKAHTGAFYGASESWVAAAASEWPQRNSNWCGIANVEVVANYTYFMKQGSTAIIPFNSGGQQRIVNDMNAPQGVSIWGAPPRGGAGPGFGADIAQDGGTDPHSIAWAVNYESTTGAYWQSWSPRTASNPAPNGPAPAFVFHNVIYHTDVAHAVGGLARALERYHMPISIIMAHGLHLDIVSGVYANNDPINNYPADVDAVNVWDPAVGTTDGGYQSSREVTWDNYTFNSNIYMWGSTYNQNLINGVPYDPDPIVGIYVPNSTYPSHWINYRTDIEPDTLINVSPEMAVDESGNVMTHP